MQDIQQATRSETTKSEQPAKVDLWEIDLTPMGGQRYFLCKELNEKGEPVIWQGRKYEAYPIHAGEFEMNGSGPGARPTLIISNLFGMVTGIAEDFQSLVGGVVVRRQVYGKFLDAVNFEDGNPDASPEQEAVARYSIEQLSELTSLTATFVLASPTETEGSVFPGRVMLAEMCTWIYRDEDCGYNGPPVADEFDRPTANPAEDRCSKCPQACKMRGNIASYGGFLSVNKLS